MNPPEQLHLDLTTAPLQPAEGETIRARFESFHALNPWVYEALERTVGQVLEEVTSLLAGEVRLGYKGGEFTFDEQTPLWADAYGQVDYRVPTGVRSDIGRQVMVTTSIIPDEYRELW